MPRLKRKEFPGEGAIYCQKEILNRDISCRGEKGEAKFNLAAGCIGGVMLDFNDHSLPAATGVNTYISFGF